LSSLEIIAALVSTLGICFAFASLISAYRSNQMRKSIKDVEIEIQESKQSNLIKEMKIHAIKKNPRTSLIFLILEIERELNEMGIAYGVQNVKGTKNLVLLLAEKGVLDNRWKESFLFLWQIRNSLFHGASISDGEADNGLQLATLLKAMLDSSKQKNFPKSVYKFELIKNAENKYYWHLRTPIGKILATSEIFDTKMAAKESIKIFSDVAKSKNFLLDESLEQ
jgi:uncharacterized protein YegP (UPF0339 family)